MDKDALQQLAADRLKNSGRLACLWATGIGKSGVLLKFLKGNPGLNTLILVPETNNIDNWYGEFAKFGVSTDGVVCACYASLHKFENTQWDVLVIDEAPHANTELKIALFKTIQAKYVLALGAVISEEELDTLKKLYGEFIVWRIGLNQAIKSGYLPVPTVYVMHMELDDTKKTFLYNGHLYTERQMYDIYNWEVEQTKIVFNQNQSSYNRIKMNRAGLNRKRFLGSRKEEAMKYVCSVLESKKMRFLCFCPSVAQAESLGGERAFTSKTPKSMNVLERFNNHEINSLYVVGKLIEGQTLNDIHCGIIGQLGNSHRITVQEAGRIFRSKNPVIYVPVFDNTKDDSFLFTVTNNIPEEYIKHYKIKINQ